MAKFIDEDSDDDDKLGPSHKNEDDIWYCSGGPGNL